MLTKFLRDDDGATAIEYALIAALIGIAIVTTFTAASSELQATFSGIVTHFQEINSN